MYPCEWTKLVSSQYKHPAVHLILLDAYVIHIAVVSYSAHWIGSGYPRAFRNLSPSIVIPLRQSHLMPQSLRSSLEALCFHVVGTEVHSGIYQNWFCLEIVSAASVCYASHAIAWVGVSQGDVIMHWSSFISKLFPTVATHHHMRYLCTDLCLVNSLNGVSLEFIVLYRMIIGISLEMVPSGALMQSHVNSCLFPRLTCKIIHMILRSKCCPCYIVSQVSYSVLLVIKDLHYQVILITVQWNQSLCLVLCDLRIQVLFGSYRW